MRDFVESWTVPASSRREMLALGLGTALLAAAGPAFAKAGGGALRVARYRGRSDPSLLLQAAGVEPPPYPIDYAEFASGNVIVEAINAGAIDFGMMSEIPPVFARQSDARLKLIAVLTGDVNSQVVLVPHNSQAQSIADLKGKRVGYVRATTSHYFLLKMLQEVGLGFGDIIPVNLPPADGQAAFASGALDAWAIFGYPVLLAIHGQGARILKTALGYLSGSYLIAAHPDAIADPARHASIADYLTRLRAGYRWLNANHAAWAPIEARAIGLPENLILEQLQGESAPAEIKSVDEAAIVSEQAVADTFSAAGLIPGVVDMRPLWDRSFDSALERS